MENGPLQKAVLQLSKQDNEINEIIINYGLPSDKMSKGGFETFAENDCRTTNIS